MEFVSINRTSVGVGVRAFPSVRPILLIGNFDGMHLGHQDLIKQAKELAKKSQAPLAVMSFSPHPRYFFQSDVKGFSIISENIKKKLMASYGIDYFYNVNFDDSVSNTKAEDFIRLFLNDTIAPIYVIVGNNFRFGKAREGNTEFLRKTGKKYSINTQIANLFKKKGEVVSSSIIRSFLTTGDVLAANSFLGWEWFIDLRVISLTNNNKNCVIEAKPVDKNIISLQHGCYQSHVINNEERSISVFSLHEDNNSIRISLPEFFCTDNFLANDVIRIYPEYKTVLEKWSVT